MLLRFEFSDLLLSIFFSYVWYRKLTNYKSSQTKTAKIVQRRGGVWRGSDPGSTTRDTMSNLLPYVYYVTIRTIRTPYVTIYAYHTLPYVTIRMSYVTIRCHTHVTRYHTLPYACHTLPYVTIRMSHVTIRYHTHSRNTNNIPKQILIY